MVSRDSNQEKFLYNEWNLNTKKKNIQTDQAPNDIWELFYETTPKSSPVSGQNVATQVSENECFLYDCIFIITTNSAISFEKSNNKFLNSDCSFNNCSSNTNGGSIYFNCSSSIVQYRSCGYKSKTNDQGHHSYVESVYKWNNKNYLYESSFYECGNLEKSFTNYLQYGNIEVKSINTSFCEANFDSGIILYEPTSLSNVTYSSFCNTTSNYLILSLDWGNYSFNFCNVLNNEHKKSDYGTTFSAFGSTVLIENSSFLGNTGPGKEFYQKRIGSITVKDSFCDRIDKTYRAVTTNNVQNTSSIHNLSHLSSYLCEAEFPILDKKPMRSAFDLYHQFSFRRRR